MIEKNEVILMANKLSLSPDTVEKDYVLSWLLWGINNHQDFADTWLFKGGTSLKKCFFETFRFSEDLDFTLIKAEHLSVDLLKNKFNEITENIHEETGINFFKEQFKFKILPKKDGKFSAQCNLHYNGPLRRKNSFASIKLDLTNEEVVLSVPEKKKVYHPYSDEPVNDIWATCYSFEEVVAEKIRALGQRARPRDLYDVIHFYRNKRLINDRQLVYRILEEKCNYKGINIPNFFSIQKHEKISELSSQWHNMLAHQLPALPPLDTFWLDLESFFDWLYGNLREENIADLPKMNGEIYQPERLRDAFSFDAVTQKILFAAANRVCIEIVYKNEIYRIEPLSFRKTIDGNIFFYGYELNSDLIKEYLLLDIQNVYVTNSAYQGKKYSVEIQVMSNIISKK